MEATRAQQPAAATDGDKPKQPTEYVVLRKTEAKQANDLPMDNTWQVMNQGKTYSAATAQAAIKEATDGEGTFIAVPARSWKPMTRKIEKVERDLWS